MPDEKSCATCAHWQLRIDEPLKHMLHGDNPCTAVIFKYQLTPEHLLLLRRASSADEAMRHVPSILVDVAQRCGHYRARIKAERDPTLDPRKGDCVRVRNTYIDIYSFSPGGPGGGTVTWKLSGVSRAASNTTSLHEWRAYCASSRVEVLFVNRSETV